MKFMPRRKNIWNLNNVKIIQDYQLQFLFSRNSLRTSRSPLVNNKSTGEWFLHLSVTYVNKIKAKHEISKFEIKRNTYRVTDNVYLNKFNMSLTSCHEQALLFRVVP